MSTESTASPHPYPPPLDRLLGLGAVSARRREWRDYTALGLTAEHVPDLLRMAADDRLNWADPEDPLVFAPLHAWRTLGQLRAPEAAAPLADLLLRYEDHWAKETIPRALGMIGEPSLEPARALLADEAADTYTRIAAAGALHEVAVAHPELRDRAVALLAERLRAWPDQDESLNGFLIDYLVELRAVEAAPLMQAAFEAGRADPAIRGDWEDVQIALGLLKQRLTPRPTYSWMERLRARPTPAPPREISAGEKARKQRKAQKQAGKRKKK